MVLDLENDLSATRVEADGDGPRASGVLGRVVQEVEQGFGNPVRVEARRGKRSRQLGLDEEPLAREVLRVRLDRRGDGGGQIARSQVVLFLPALDARGIEDPVDEMRQPVALASDDLAVAAPLLVQAPPIVEQRLAVEPDQRERCLQLVRDPLTKSDRRRPASRDGVSQRRGPSCARSRALSSLFRAEALHAELIDAERREAIAAAASARNVRVW
jgi:hypothetical protein